MSSFSLHVATGNAAFGDAPAFEIARLLRELADKLEDDGIVREDGRVGANAGVVADVNGNTVGRWFHTDRSATHDDAAALDAIEQALTLGAGTARLANIAEYTGRRGFRK